MLGCASIANGSDASVLPIENALEVMDLEILHSGFVDFSNPELHERYNSAKKMEIMVPHRIPVNLIENLS